MHRPQACGAGQGRTMEQEVKEGQESVGRGIRTSSSLSHKPEKNGWDGAKCEVYQPLCKRGGPQQEPKVASGADMQSPNADLVNTNHV
jgi:hypothetical protein